jgi:hypothetical protein
MLVQRLFGSPQGVQRRLHMREKLDPSQSIRAWAGSSFQFCTQRAQAELPDQGGRRFQGMGREEDGMPVPPLMGGHDVGGVHARL